MTKMSINEVNLTNIEFKSLILKFEEFFLGSMKTKPLNAQNRKELKKWLTEHNCPNKKLHKECADCEFVAQLVQKLTCELCTASKYSKCGRGYKARLANWERLNEDVLSKLWLRQSKSQLECYAQGKRYASEHLLYEIMRRVGILALDQKKEPEKQTKEDDFITVNVYETVGSSIVMGERRMSDWAKYEAALKASQGQDDFLGLAQQKFKQLTFVTEETSQEMLQRSRIALQAQSPTKFQKHLVQNSIGDAVLAEL